MLLLLTHLLLELKVKAKDNISVTALEISLHKTPDNIIINFAVKFVFSSYEQFINFIVLLGYLSGELD